MSNQNIHESKIPEEPQEIDEPTKKLPTTIQVVTISQAVSKIKTQETNRRDDDHYTRDKPQEQNQGPVDFSNFHVPDDDPYFEIANEVHGDNLTQVQTNEDLQNTKNLENLENLENSPNGNMEETKIDQNDISTDGVGNQISYNDYRGMKHSDEIINTSVTQRGNESEYDFYGREKFIPPCEARCGKDLHDLDVYRVVPCIYKDTYDYLWNKLSEMERRQWQIEYYAKLNTFQERHSDFFTHLQLSPLQIVERGEENARSGYDLFVIDTYRLIPYKEIITYTYLWNTLLITERGDWKMRYLKQSMTKSNSFNQFFCLQCMKTYNRSNCPTH